MYTTKSLVGSKASQGSLVRSLGRLYPDWLKSDKLGAIEAAVTHHRGRTGEG